MSTNVQSLRWNLALDNKQSKKLIIFSVKLIENRKVTHAYT